MNITKHAISNNTKPFSAVNVISKINYIQIENAEGFNSFCRGIAENLNEFCALGLKLPESERGTAVIINEMSVTYFSDELISLKCDFTVSFNSVLTFHRRYCINYMITQNVLLLPKLVKGLGKCPAGLFFLTSREEELFAVPIANKSIVTPAKLGRKSQIDSFCNGQPRRVKIKNFHCSNGDRTPSP